MTIPFTNDNTDYRIYSTKYKKPFLKILFYKQQYRFMNNNIAHIFYSTNKCFLTVYFG